VTAVDRHGHAVRLLFAEKCIMLNLLGMLQEQWQIAGRLLPVLAAAAAEAIISNSSVPSAVHSSSGRTAAPPLHQTPMPLSMP
jgi:hypothetical protein